MVTINTPEASYRDEFLQNGGRIYTLERNLRHPFALYKMFDELARGYDILHAHGNSATMVLEMYAAKKAGVPVRIAHSHNSNCKYHIVDKFSRIPFMHSAMPVWLVVRKRDIGCLRIELLKY